MNHRNRSKNPLTPGRDPLPSDIRAARERAGLTQTEAADLIHATMRSWQDWEAGVAKMRPYAFGYFLMSTGQITAEAQIERFQQMVERKLSRA